MCSKRRAASFAIREPLAGRTRSSADRGRRCRPAPRSRPPGRGAARPGGRCGLRGPYTGRRCRRSVRGAFFSAPKLAGVSLSATSRIPTRISGREPSTWTLLRAREGAGHLVGQPRGPLDEGLRDCTHDRILSVRAPRGPAPRSGSHRFYGRRADPDRKAGKKRGRWGGSFPPPASSGSGSKGFFSVEPMPDTPSFERQGRAIGRTMQARIFHQLPAADADPCAVAGRTPSRHFDVVSTTPSASLSPCGQPQRRLGALATKVREISGQAAAFPAHPDVPAGRPRTGAPPGRSRAGRSAPPIRRREGWPQTVWRGESVEGAQTPVIGAAGPTAARESPTRPRSGAGGRRSVDRAIPPIPASHGGSPAPGSVP